MHPVGTLCCYLTGMALRRTFLWRVIQAGSWRKVGQILRSSWVNGQLSREQDKEGHMKTLQGRGWLIIFLYLSYQFKISSELEILWDRLLEVCVAVYTRILWELWVDMFTYSSNEHLVFYGMKGHKFPIVHIARISQPCNYQQELGFLFNVRTTQEGMRDMRYCLDGIYAINIFWKRQEGQGRSRGTFKWYLLKPSELFPNIPPKSRLPSDYRRKQLGLWPVGLKRSTKLKFNGAE